MAIIFNTKDLVDQIIEITAMKSRFLLTENNVRTLSEKHEELKEIASYIEDDESIVRIYPEEFDNYVLSLRKAIGNISDTSDGIAILVRSTNQLIADGHNIDSAIKVVHELIARRKLYDANLIISLCRDNNAELKTFFRLMEMYAEMQDRSSICDLLDVSPEIKEWDGIRPLDLLFESETIPSKGVHYFDQEFINYLNENGHDLQRMHWRNFERLIAEFFRRIGYAVDLGPGRNDGGVDIRVYNMTGREKGPPLMIVQCKRYSESNLVDINTVKAFYADTIYEDATMGLIATTSRISTGGKKIIRARGYNLQVAEAEQVKLMINSMWRQHWTYK